MNIFLSSNFWRFVFVFFGIAFVAISPVYLFREKNFKLNLNQFLNLESNTKVVLDLCHVETFEGGSASREGYLKRQAQKFNKENNNFFISITTMSLDEFELNMEHGYEADMYSFGVGAGEKLKSKLQPLKKINNIRDDLQKNAMIDGKIYAYPYILSGYAVISYENLTANDENLTDKLKSQAGGKKNINGCVFGTGNDNPAQALAECGITLSMQDLTIESSSYLAYTTFLNKKTKSLVGTARDVARIKNREQIGSISPCVYSYLSGYSDLIQYVGISRLASGVKGEVATSFAKFLLQEEAQRDLSSIGLFSVTNSKIYEGDFMGEFENTLQKPLKSISAFVSKKEIEIEQTKALENLCKN
ncbi:MAG: hypothetical protein ACI4L7_02920 [Christensenellales bacterium]